MSIMGDRVPAAVLRAFDARSAPVALADGQIGAWRSGDLVLKRVFEPEEARWCAEALAAVVEDQQFRVARPVAATSGWIVDGWSAWRWVAGRSADHRLHEIMVAGQAFHRAIRHVGRPEFIDRRDDPWSHGDRIAWQEEPLPDVGPWHRELHLLAALRTEVSAPAQLVHPDLAGNVLFAPGMAPAVIDWPPCWRPPGWAIAVVAIDGLDTGRARLADVMRLGNGAEWLQFMIRAELYRIGTKNHAALLGQPITDDKLHHSRTVASLARLAAKPGI